MQRTNQKKELLHFRIALVIFNIQNGSGIGIDKIGNFILSKVNPDLKYYINNDYLDELISLLIEGVSQAIEENNRKVISDIEREIRLKRRGTI